MREGGIPTGVQDLCSSRVASGSRSVAQPYSALPGGSKIGRGRERSGQITRPNRRTRPSQPAVHRVVQTRLVTFALCSIALLGGLSIWVPALKHAIIQHPYFTVQKIVVHSDGGLSHADVQEWSKIRTGASIFEIDPWQIEAELLTQPWVASAVVKRDLAAVHIQVHARRPVAIIRGVPGSYLDQQGTSFFDPSEQSQGVQRDLPYISGVAALPLDTPQARQVLVEVHQLLSLARLWRNSGPGSRRDQVSEIHWDAQHGYTLFLSHRQATIRVGWHIIPEKFVHIGRVLETWPVDGPAAVFDARFADQIVVRPASQERPQQAHARDRSAKGEEDYV